MARGDPEKAAVLTAFFAARAANRPAFECYKAGVQVWKGLHPEQAPGYAAKAAVQVILDAVAHDMLSVEHEGVRRPGTEPDDWFASPAHREAATVH
jgi:hypothetical protein